MCQPVCRDLSRATLKIIRLTLRKLLPSASVNDTTEFLTATPPVSFIVSRSSSGGKKDTAYRLEIPSMKTRYKHFNDAGVYDLTVDDADVAPVYYNLQGMRIAKPQPGTVVIVKRGARVTKEIVVE